MAYSRRYRARARGGYRKKTYRRKSYGTKYRKSGYRKSYRKGSSHGSIFARVARGRLDPAGSAVASRLGRMQKHYTDFVSGLVDAIQSARLRAAKRKAELKNYGIE